MNKTTALGQLIAELAKDEADNEQLRMVIKKTLSSKDDEALMVALDLAKNNEKMIVHIGDACFLESHTAVIEKDGKRYHACLFFMPLVLSVDNRHPVNFPQELVGIESLQNTLQPIFSAIVTDEFKLASLAFSPVIYSMTDARMLQPSVAYEMLNTCVNGFQAGNVVFPEPIENAHDAIISNSTDAPTLAYLIGFAVYEGDKNLDLFTLYNILATLSLEKLNSWLAFQIATQQYNANVRALAICIERDMLYTGLYSSHIDSFTAWFKEVYQKSVDEDFSQCFAHFALKQNKDKLYLVITITDAEENNKDKKPKFSHEYVWELSPFEVPQNVAQHVFSIVASANSSSFAHTLPQSIH